MGIEELQPNGDLSWAGLGSRRPVTGKSLSVPGEYCTNQQSLVHPEGTVAVA
ncbi:MAG: hypothetical protein ABSA93_33215 [Streptosporangiaceae bacterium]|jgi:hypothetical protein